MKESDFASDMHTIAGYDCLIIGVDPLTAAKTERRGMIQRLLQNL